MFVDFRIIRIFLILVKSLQITVSDHSPYPFSTIAIISQNDLTINTIFKLNEPNKNSPT